MFIVTHVRIASSESLIQSCGKVRSLAMYNLSRHSALSAESHNLLKDNVCTETTRKHRRALFSRTPVPPTLIPCLTLRLGSVLVQSR